MVGSSGVSPSTLLWPHWKSSSVRATFRRWKFLPRAHQSYARTARTRWKTQMRTLIFSGIVSSLVYTTMTRAKSCWHMRTSRCWMLSEFAAARKPPNRLVMAFLSQLDHLRMRQWTPSSALLTSAKSRLISPNRQPRPRQLRHTVPIVVVDLMRSRHAQHMAGNAMAAKVADILRRFARRRRNRRLALTRRLVSWSYAKLHRQPRFRRPWTSPPGWTRSRRALFWRGSQTLEAMLTPLASTNWTSLMNFWKTCRLTKTLSPVPMAKNSGHSGTSTPRCNWMRQPMTRLLTCTRSWPMRFYLGAHWWPSVYFPQSDRMWCMSGVLRRHPYRPLRQRSSASCYVDVVSTAPGRQESWASCCVVCTTPGRWPSPAAAVGGIFWRVRHFIAEAYAWPRYEHWAPSWRQAVQCSFVTSYSICLSRPNQCSAGRNGGQPHHRASVGNLQLVPSDRHLRQERYQWEAHHSGFQETQSPSETSGASCEDRTWRRRWHWFCKVFFKARCPSRLLTGAPHQVCHGDDDIHHDVRPLSVPSQPARVDFGRRRIQSVNRRCPRWIAEFRENRRRLPCTWNRLGDSSLSRPRHPDTSPWARDHHECEEVCVRSRIRRLLWVSSFRRWLGRRRHQSFGDRGLPYPCKSADRRSLMGLVNQVSEFTPKLAEQTAPLRGLVKTSNEFTWTANHTSAFNATKTELVSPPTLAFYQLGLNLRLEINASALKGLGFVLWQRHGEQWRVVQCGSRYLSDTETRYAVFELEMLAVVWALHKCRLYLSGTKFEIVTDHGPLVLILNLYSLDQIENSRLLRLRLKVQSFQFHVSCRKSTENVFADALSHNPLDIPTPEEEFSESPALSCRTTRVCLQSQETQSPPVNLRFKVLRDAAAVDEDFQQLVEFVRSCFPPSMRDVPASLRAYWNGREHLSLDSGIVMKGDRIVVPESLRETVLADLHAAHQGLSRTKSRARQI